MSIYETGKPSSLSSTVATGFWLRLNLTHHVLRFMIVGGIRHLNGPFLQKLATAFQCHMRIITPDEPYDDGNSGAYIVAVAKALPSGEDVPTPIHPISERVRQAISLGKNWWTASLHLKRTGEAKQEYLYHYN